MMLEPHESPLRRIVHIVKNRGTHAIPVKPRRIRLRSTIVSFTFDDFAKSAWTEGGRLVADHGGRATFYLVGSHCGKTVDGVRQYDDGDLHDILSGGHEIGCHTFDHIPLPDHSSEDIARTLDHNQAFFRTVAGGSGFQSFAYPFGLASVRTKRLLKDRFIASRGIYPGINRGWADFSQLNGFCLHHSDLSIDRVVQSALRRPGWLIFIGHDVSKTPGPFGCTPDVLKEALRKVSQAGLEMLTVGAALARIGGSEVKAAEASN
jgi:peptidoglycan/xylan/chitin deacetylase (PgdA/CDA1 family)